MSPDNFPNISEYNKYYFKKINNFTFFALESLQWWWVECCHYDDNNPSELVFVLIWAVVVLSTRMGQTEAPWLFVIYNKTVKCAFNFNNKLIIKEWRYCIFC